VLHGHGSKSKLCHIYVSLANSIQGHGLKVAMETIKRIGECIFTKKGYGSLNSSVLFSSKADVQCVIDR